MAVRANFSRNASRNRVIQKQHIIVIIFVCGSCLGTYTTALLQKICRLLDNKDYLDVKTLLVSYFSFYNSKENITFFQKHFSLMRFWKLLLNNVCDWNLKKPPLRPENF